jgi:probable F420-dependent oxidoreductase
VKFGALLLYSGMNDPDFLVKLGEIAEECGFDALWLADHVVMPTTYDSKYPYNTEGKLPGVAFPEPLTSLAYLAATTHRIELGTGVLILPERNPVVLAKQAATLDRLARGRLRLGVGVGWLREEFEAIGVPFEERGARTDEHIDAMRALWRHPEPTFDGTFTRFSGVSLQPPPSRPGGVPIVIGGHSVPAAKRAARRGDGFFPFGHDANGLRTLYEAMRTECREIGRPEREIELIAAPGKGPDVIREMADLGVGQIVVASSAPDSGIEALRGRLGRYSDRVISPAR